MQGNAIGSPDTAILRAAASWRCHNRAACALVLLGYELEASLHVTRACPSRLKNLSISWSDTCPKSFPVLGIRRSGGTPARVDVPRSCVREGGVHIRTRRISSSEFIWGHASLALR